MIPTHIKFKPIYVYKSIIGYSFSFDLLYDNIKQYSITGYKDRDEKVIFSPFSNIPKSLNSMPISQLLTEDDLKLYYKIACQKRSVNLKMNIT